MKRIFDYIEGFPSSTIGHVPIAPPTFWENVTGAAVTFLFLIALFFVIAGISWTVVKAWEWIEGRRAVRYGVVRRIL